MDRVRLVAVSEFPFDGRHLSAGDHFDASARDATTLKLLNKAVDAPPGRAGYVTRDMRADQARAAAEAAPRPKRTYRRRDLIAETINGSDE